MKKFNRKERIAAIMNILTEKTNHVFTYNYFTKMFGTAKSSISEDIMIVKDLVKDLELGKIITISGASGGVKFIPTISKKESEEFLKEISLELGDNNRIITGGFMYMTDILYSPNISYKIGRIFVTKYWAENIDYVVTVETKGIPLAMMTAKILNVPLVIIRRNLKVTEGPTVSINYVSGSTRKIQTMSLSRKAIREGARVLIIDDFMKAGGTAKGMKDMMKEFKAEVVGTGVLISTPEPKKKLIEEYTALINLKSINDVDNEIILTPNDKY
ncbi:pur operon repressor [Clostridium sp. D2Q-14]|uniref:pur operon repressor n=1 Tax=Anaeromonas gelatinilytica TaxID=2683194 RepID=UPI00193AF5FD|nr:pur operon repressor [Anaeromonas gelatinilytica]MBS4534676.1 pur operon repressor [Anaeromonas gelatinilytica]